ncbi:MAG: hypothetical protein ACXVEE_17280 [Polyangiales bacterium]
MRASQSPTWSTSLPAGCHVAQVDLVFVGSKDGLEGWRFEIRSERVFDSTEGAVLEIETYEAPNISLYERPALRYRERRGT